MEKMHNYRMGYKIWGEKKDPSIDQQAKVRVTTDKYLINNKLPEKNSLKTKDKTLMEIFGGLYPSNIILPTLKNQEINIAVYNNVCSIIKKTNFNFTQKFYSLDSPEFLEYLNEFAKKNFPDQGAMSSRVFDAKEIKVNEKSIGTKITDVFEIRSEDLNFKIKLMEMTFNIEAIINYKYDDTYDD